MMNIIKHGKKPEPKILRFECQKCGCVFEAEDKECMVLTCTSFFDGNEVPISYTVECPDCTEKVTVDARYKTND